MPKDLIVRILGDSSRFEKSLRSSTSTAAGFETTLKRVGVTAEQSANTQVAASLRKDARLREEIALYRQIAGAAATGSREQIVAANLAERSERQLARSMGATATEAKLLGSSTRTFNRDLGAASRGALAGSGIFRGLGRSIVFASGGFLAFGGAAAFVRKSIDAAKEAQVVNAQLEQQFKNNKRSLEPYRAEIDRTSNSISALSGFENDELKAALVTILRTQPNITKALRDEATAADLARAKRLGLAQAATIIAKVEAGNTTLLRRQGIQVAKNATAEQALATLRQAVAGQARAGATDQERFGAILHNTEEIIGTGVLPTLNKYLTSGGHWLEQMNESGQLQKEVAGGAHEIEQAVKLAAGAIHDIDSVTGGFKQTLELLLALKAASVVTGWAGAFAHAASEEGKASREAQLLHTRLKLLPTTLAITIGIEVLLNKKAVDQAVGNFLDSHHLGLLGGTKEATIKIPANVTVDQLDTAIAKLKSLKGAGDLEVKVLEKVADRMAKVGSTAGEMGVLTDEAGAKAAHGLGLAAQALGNLQTAAAHPINITIAQRNTFFDNNISRILLRGGLGDIDQQISALQQADAKIAARIKATKDVTRRQNLEDELLQNEASIRDLQAQKTSDALQKSQDALQKRRDSFDQFVASLELRVTEAQATKGTADDIRALKALQAGIESEIREFGKTSDLASSLFDVQQQLAAARASQITGRQFLALGLTQTGDQRIPGVRALKRALGNVSDEVAGTFLDTNKTKSLLTSIRKVLSGGLGAVGEDVRAKIQSILGDLNRQLDQSTQKNLTKWRHLSTQAILAGVPDLSPTQKRILENRLSVLGPNAGAPPTRTAAFALAATSFGKFTLEATLNVDGEKMATNTTSHQIKRGKQRTIPRSG